MTPPSTPPPGRFLVADVGGTHTRLGFADGARVIAGTVRNYANEGAASAEEILRRFLREQGSPPCDGCCVAAAGPKIDGRVRMTNLDWVIDPANIRAAVQIEKVALLNDLEAVGYALDGLDGAKLVPILNAAPPHAPTAVRDIRLVIGVGTGFNACVVLHHGGDGHGNDAATNAPMVSASECGHISLPVLDETDLRLGDFIRRRNGFASVEEALSGRGLETVYAWICETRGQPQSKSAADICATDDATADSPTAAAVQVFMRILGMVTGDLALIHLPFGGIYLAGGMVRRLAPRNPAAFIKAFQTKGRKADFMTRFPVVLIDDDFAALTGCTVALGAGCVRKRTAGGIPPAPPVS